MAMEYILAEISDESFVFSHTRQILHPRCK